jgi:hypothetical protein
LVPQAEVVTVPPVAAELDDAGAEDAAALVLAAALDGAAAELLEEELELQPATTPIATAAMTAAAVRVRQWKDLFMCSAFSWLTASSFFGTSAYLRTSGNALRPGWSEPKKPPSIFIAKRCLFALLLRSALSWLPWIMAMPPGPCGPAAENGLITFACPSRRLLCVLRGRS